MKRPLFASLTQQDRVALVGRLDRALWWSDSPAALVAAVARVCGELMPEYQDAEARSSVLSRRRRHE